MSALAYQAVVDQTHQDVEALVVALHKALVVVSAWELDLMLVAAPMWGEKFKEKIIHVRQKVKLNSESCLHCT